jgi:hypothetical protein
MAAGLNQDPAAAFENWVAQADNAQKLAAGQLNPFVGGRLPKTIS